MKQQTIVTLDLEGVLIPEIWIAFAEKTGITELSLTHTPREDFAWCLETQGSGATGVRFVFRFFGFPDWPSFNH